MSQETDMTKLAKAMDPNMGGNMSAIVKSVDNLAKNVTQMNTSVSGMEKPMLWMQRDISTLRAPFSKPMSVFNAMPFL